MPDYSKLKNAELEALLKERGLPHTGKKAEMVARLQENDNKAEPAPVATANEDEIDWDDDAAPAETAPGASTIDNKLEGNNPAAVPNQVSAIDPSTTDDLSVNPPAANGEEKKAEDPVAEVPDFTAGLATTDLESEIAKRKARAEKFGIKEGEEDPDALEAIRKLERAKKFNETDGAINKLDMALPERRENKRRRDGGGGGGDERGDYKRRGGRGGGRNFSARRGGERGFRRDGGGDRRPREERSGGGGGGGSWMNDADQKAAEARKARWA